MGEFSDGLTRRRDLQIGAELARLRGETLVHAAGHLLHETGADMSLVHPHLEVVRAVADAATDGAVSAAEAAGRPVGVVPAAAGGVAAGQTVERPPLPPAA